MEELTGPDIMAYPMYVGEFILNTDASLDTVGAVLFQVQDGVEWVIAYGSRTLSKQGVKLLCDRLQTIGSSFLHGILQALPVGKAFCSLDRPLSTEVVVHSLRTKGQDSSVVRSSVCIPVLH